jgi:hypothetical protein
MTQLKELASYHVEYLRHSQVRDPVGIFRQKQQPQTSEEQFSMPSVSEEYFLGLLRESSFPQTDHNV